MTIVDLSQLMKPNIEKWIKFSTKSFMIMKFYMTNNDNNPIRSFDIIH